MANIIILKEIIFTIIGFIIVIIFFFITYIRQRLPKVIPFTLTEYYFWLLVCLCLFYLFLIKNLLYPKQSNNNIAISFRTFVGLPFAYFDSKLKYNKLSFSYYIQLVQYVVSKTYTKGYGDYIFVLYCFQIIPKIILCSILVIDIFYLQNIKIFYYFIILSLLPLSYTYYKYSLAFDFEQLIKHLEKKYEQVYLFQVNPTENEEDDFRENEIAEFHDKLVSIREYILIHYNNLTNTKELWYYDITPLAKENIYLEYRKKHNKVNHKLSSEDNSIIDNDFNQFMPLILELNVCLNTLKEIQNYAYISRINITINIIYLICWSYILIKSYPTLKDINITLDIINILKEYHNFEEPFSGLYTLNMKVNNDFITFCVTYLYYLTLKCLSLLKLAISYIGMKYLYKKKNSNL